MVGFLWGYRRVCLVMGYKLLGLGWGVIHSTVQYVQYN